MSLTGKRICITGGAGFIGSHLTQLLIEDNEIVVYDNLHRNAIQFAHLDGHRHLTFIKGDVMDADSTRRAVAGCNIVIHCAAIAGVYSVDRNAVTTMEVRASWRRSICRTRTTRKMDCRLSSCGRSTSTVRARSAMAPFAE